MQENARKKAEHQLISELIDYREYLVSLASLTMRGKQKDFIKLVFNLYDEDGNGEVDREEYSVRAPPGAVLARVQRSARCFKGALFK